MKKKYFIGKGIGHSMSPVINPGDKIYIEETPFFSLKKGDIIVFFYKNKLISHRIINRYFDSVLTKGDNSAFFDKLVNKKSIFGRTVVVVGKYGRINFNTKAASFIKYYYLFYSLMTYYLPFITFLIVSKILRGRRILLKFLS